MNDETLVERNGWLVKLDHFGQEISKSRILARGSEATEIAKEKTGLSARYYLENENGEKGFLW